MIEIDSINKAKFITQYWGQNVVSHNEYQEGSTNLVDGSLIKKFSEENYFLYLKRLEDISDEDLEKIYHIHSGIIGYDYTMDFQSPLIMAKHWKDNDLNWNKTIFKYREIVDYLRSKGYALPFMNLSIENLVRIGWIKFQIK